MTDSDRPVTDRELREQLAATKAELKTELREALNGLRDELRTHFDAVAEQFRDEFKSLHDWVEAGNQNLSSRVGALETGHGAQLLSLETRVTALEHGHRPK